MRTFLDRFYEGCRLALRATILSALFLFAFRVAFIIRHAGPQTNLSGTELYRALLMGARFDLKVGAFMALPFLVLGALCTGRARWMVKGWAGLSAFFLAFLAIVNDGYFEFYHSPIDPIVFGVVEDDTKTVFRALWADHHIILGPLAAILLAWLLAWLVARPAKRAPGLRLRTAVAVVVPVLLLLAIRGRVGGFPLNQKDFTVASERLLNSAVPNGPIALLVAYSDRTMVRIGKDPYEGLRRAGFQRPAQAAAVLGLAPETATDEEVARALFRRTPANPRVATHRPHVVVVIMESWGADLLRYHSDRNDILGRLAPHLDRGLVFQRFVASTNGTDGAFESILVNTPISPLTAGAQGYIKFEQASAVPFRQAGYRTVFAMGWSGNWRGMGRAMPNQGFDEVYDLAQVSAGVPHVPVGPRGVPDHGVLEFAMQRLHRADEQGEALFMVLVTSTNHSPHQPPPGYAARPVDVTVLGDRGLGDPARLRARLQTYQYMSDSLGGFLDAVEAKGLSPRTIVAAVGDHSTREFFKYSGTQDLPWRDRVNFFLKVPQEYLEGRTVDLDRWGGQRDIFPTLAGLVLSEASVYAIGEDLLAPPTRPARALARFQTVLSDAGVVPQLGTPGVLCWGPKGELSADPDAPCGPAMIALEREERATKALMDWEVRRQVVAAPPYTERAKVTAAEGAVTPGARN